ncbi:hypothetical protein FEM48_Zijuj03G0144700 [Ziziphus jujuba var. spinosa]|uniref:Embryo-specific protein ATS3B-like n=1 Tax=Ziziphus jujuba var. spinosa TaxID=714518 RepID=A0A978VQV1_ZIZJJ|nr:hypothetical protein FEM48_Zijuj03G0144700 [Ziziphus jujuba var. spinosa]
MMRALSILLLSAFIFNLSVAEELSSPLPHAANNFNLSYIQNEASCSYSVVITTSCSSSKYTRDQISIAFGDAYGNQIYVPRLDDPSSGAFERCSSDTFDIYGPCAYQICYVYLYRSGPDGWKPESVKIYGDNSRAVTFTYNTFIPSDVWYGFNLCNDASSSYQRYGRRWFTVMIMGLVFVLLYAY